MWKKGQALVPTWTAFAVVSLMEQHFDELVDYDFTARIDDDLDAIANGERQKEQWLQAFYFGDGDLPGLKRLVEENLDQIDAAEINTFPIGVDPDGNEVVVKPGKYGPVRQAGRRHRRRARRHGARRADGRRGAGAAGGAEDRRADRRARRLPGVRQERPLRAVRAVGHARRPAARARQAEDGEPVQDDGARADHASTRPRRCCRCPARSASTRPTAQPIVANNGRYGPYVQKGKDYRNIDNEERLFTITLRRGAARSSPSRRCTGAAGRPWPPPARCASSAPTPSASGRSSPRTAASASTSPTARRTRRSARATASRR